MPWRGEAGQAQSVSVWKFIYFGYSLCNGRLRLHCWDCGGSVSVLAYTTVVLVSVISVPILVCVAKHKQIAYDPARRVARVVDAGSHCNGCMSI